MPDHRSAAVPAVSRDQDGRATKSVRRTGRRSVTLVAIAMFLCSGTLVWAAGGTLTLKATEEQSDSPAITRLEVWRGSPGGKRVPLKRTVPAGVGVVLDRQLDITLPDNLYSFRMIRGPEYRIVSGTFQLETTSLDEHSVRLPRMVNMLQEGWTSGDCCVVASPHSLPLRMAAEDLHLARTLGHVQAKPIAGRKPDEPPENDPAWIASDAKHFGGLVFYGDDSFGDGADDSLLPSQRIAQANRADGQIRIAIENPFAWPLPVWLASEKIDGVFVLGDWLQLDKKILRVSDGRSPSGPQIGDARSVGRWAERIYWNLLEAGFRIPPLAGSGSESRQTPVGYNRLYVAGPIDSYRQDGKLVPKRVANPQAWWDGAWQGNSVATNGPLLRPLVGGKIPGHVFTAKSGEALKLEVELNLSVRDPVDYLEVIHNGRVHHSAKLDEFAKAGGRIPPLLVKESGWVTIRVVTLYEDHFRAAMSAPWYIDFDSRPRMTAEGVEFFQSWLSEYETRLLRLPAPQLARHVPFVRAARSFWAERAKRVAP